MRDCAILLWPLWLQWDGRRGSKEQGKKRRRRRRKDERKEGRGGVCVKGRELYRMCVYVCVRGSMCVCMCVCACVCMYVCVLRESVGSGGRRE